MNHYFKSVIPVIESNYNKFTTVEKSIADFFINNQKKADFSAKDSSIETFCFGSFSFPICAEMWISWISGIYLSV